MSRSQKFFFAVLAVLGLALLGVGLGPLIKKKFFTKAVCLAREYNVGVCADDVKFYCSNFGGYRLENCLNENVEKLSKSCQNYFAPCRSLMQTLCGHIPPGPNRYKCMLDSWDQLSPNCQDSIDYHEQCRKAKAQKN